MTELEQLMREAILMRSNPQASHEGVLKADQAVVKAMNEIGLDEVRFIQIS